MFRATVYQIFARCRENSDSRHCARESLVQPSAPESGSEAYYTTSCCCLHLTLLLPDLDRVSIALMTLSPG